MPGERLWIRLPRATATPPEEWTAAPVARVEQAVERAATVVSAGGLLVYPTETFYGLATPARDEEAVSRLAAVKGREAGKAMPLLAATRRQVDELALVPEALAALAARFWPGPLTLALEPRRHVPPALLSANGTLGIRVSPHPLARALAVVAGVLTATSANPTGRPPPREVVDLDPELLRLVDAVIDTGPCAGSAPSTVAGVEGGRVVVYRVGAVAVRALATVLGYEPALA